MFVRACVRARASCTGCFRLARAPPKNKHSLTVTNKLACVPFEPRLSAQRATARTAAMSSDLDLAEGIAYMREHCEKVGRKDLPQIFLASITQPGEKWNPQQLIDRIGQYKEMGIVGAAVSVDGRTRAEWCDNAARVGADVIAKLK